LPDDLPVSTSANPNLKNIETELASLNNNVYANILLRLLSQQGQAFLHTVESVMKKPSNQDVVISLFDTLSDYLSDVCPNDVKYDDIDKLISDVEKYVEISALQLDDMKEVLAISSDLSESIKSIVILSLLGESLLTPVFSRTDAIGSLMRKKLDHIISPLLKEISVLKGK